MKTTFKSLLFALSLILPIHCLAADALPKEIRFGQVGGSNVKSSGGKPTSTDIVSLAEYLGLFKQEFGPNGPKITQVYFAGTGPAQNEALAQGFIEFGTYGGVPNVVGLVGGIPAHIISTRRSTGSGTYYVGVRSNSPIKTIADLRGKRITVQKGTNPYQSLIKLLESKGIAEKEVNLVNLAGTDALVAFNAGAVDAVFGGANLLILRDQGKLKLLTGTTGATHNDESQSGLLVADAFAKKHPAIVTRVLKVLLRASQWASEEKNREALIRFVSERSLAYKYTAENYKGSLKERYNPLIDESTVVAYKKTVQFCVEHKVIRKTVDEASIRSWFHPQYQQAALKELKLEKYWPTSGGPFKPRPVR